MLTKEMLTADETLKGLSDDQVTAIVTLSKNDEDAVFGAKFSEIHNNLDGIVREVTGQDKGGTEKTSDYIRRMLTEQKSAVETMQGERDTFRTKVGELEQQIAGGSADKELIKSQAATIESLREQYNTVKSEKESMETRYTSQIAEMKIRSAIEGSLGGIVMKEGYSEEALGVLRRQAVETVRGMRPEFTTVDGTETLVFHDEKGAEMRNPDNKQNLYTAKELLTKVLTGYGVVEDEQRRGGGGGRGSRRSSSVGIGTARTQTEAMDAIREALSAKGLSAGSAAWQTEFDQMWVDNKVDDLPLQ